MVLDAIRQSLPYRALRKIKRALAGSDAGSVAGAERVTAGDGFLVEGEYDRVFVQTAEPPHNLINALYNDSYFTLIDHNARGVGRHMTAAGLKNNVIENERIIFVRDDETGDFFSIGWLPVARPYARFEARSEPGLQTIVNRTGGIEATWRVLVPPGKDPVEIWDLNLRDAAGRPRRLSVFSHVSMKCDGVDLYSGDLFRVARYLPEAQAIFVQTDAEQHQKLDFPWHNGFMTADREPAGWDCNPGAFIGGVGRTLKDPKAVAEGKSGDSMMSMWPPIASLHVKLEIAAGGEACVRFLVGACDDVKMILGLRKKFFAEAATAGSDYRQIQEKTREIAEKSIFKTPDSTINGMLNVWVKLQCHYGLYWGRWGFCGYRDQLQQAIGCLNFAPGLARERILAACRHQYADGFALRGWRPIDTHRYADSAAWLIPAVTEYLKETGDFGLLEEVAPFYDGGAAAVLEHLKRAMERLHVDRGAHGLCLMHEGDWNDSLTGVCRKGRGESVWMSMMFCRCALQMRELADRLGDADLSRRMGDWHAGMARAINEHGWDGEWYLAARDDESEPIGSSRNEEGKIFLVSQAWAQLGGVVDDARWASAWGVVRRELDTGWGFRLCRPTYTKPAANVGRLSYIRPGAGENGSVYTHGNAFLMLALLERGMADEALAVWQGINPANSARPGAAIPHVFYNGFYGPDSEIMAGLADHAWTTGSCAWMFHAVLELMLGVRRTFDGLVISPCLPAAWEQAEVTRVCRGTTYRVKIENPEKCAGTIVRKMTVDGEVWEPKKALMMDGGAHDVNVILGKRQ